MIHEKCFAEIVVIEASYTSISWEIDKLKTIHNTLNVEDIA